MLTYLTPQDVARSLGLSASMVRHLEVSGKLPCAARTMNGGRLFLPEDVEQLKEKRKAKQKHNAAY